MSGEHFGELRRLLGEQPASGNTLPPFPNGPMNASYQLPGPSNVPTMGKVQHSSAVQISTKRLLGRPSVRSDVPTGSRPVAPSGIPNAPWQHTQQQTKQQLPLLHPYVPQRLSNQWPVAPPQQQPFFAGNAVDPQRRQHHQVIREPAPLDGRRAKRGKPSARRSLQAMFDAAAEDTSSYDTSNASSLLGDGEGDFSSECDFSLCASQNSGESALTISTPTLSRAGGALRRPPSPETPVVAANKDSNNGGGESTMIPLKHFLMSEQAASLSLREVKAILYKVVKDLAAMHKSNILHRSVSMDSVVLSTYDGIATAELRPHAFSLKLHGSTQCYWGPKQPSTDAFMAPEAVACPSDRCIYTPSTDMWSLGIMMFTLLAGGHQPFGTVGLKSVAASMPEPQRGLDKLQAWLKEHISCKVDVMNEFAKAQSAARSTNEVATEMPALAFDQQAKDLLFSLLHADPAQRPTAERVLQHPWLSEVVGMLPLVPTRRTNSGLTTTTMFYNNNNKSPSQTGTPTTTTTTTSIGWGSSSQDNMTSHYSLPYRRPTANLLGGGGGERGAVAGRPPRPHQTGGGTGFKREGSVSGPLQLPPCDNTLQGGVASSSRGGMASRSGNNQYAVIGHVSRQVQAYVDGQLTTVSALHAVFSVPGRGAMMSAEPIGYAPAEAVV